MIRKLSFVFILILFIQVIVLITIGRQRQILDCILGGTLMIGNLAVVMWAIRRVLIKKSIALALTIIVIKYSAILAIFLFMYSLGWRVSFGFIFGMSALFPALGWVVYKYMKQGMNDGSL